MNLLFWLTLQRISQPGPLTGVASWAFIIGAITMPLCCVVMAHFPRAHLIFAVPVMSLITGGISILAWRNCAKSTMNTKKRIGFIAMSGVRAHNEELTRLGLTLPGFVDRNKIIASLPSLGLLTLAGLTPDKFEIAYHEIADLKKLPELPADFDLVAISTFTAQFYEACEVADFYRRKNSRGHGRHHGLVAARAGKATLHQRRHRRRRIPVARSVEGF